MELVELREWLAGAGPGSFALKVLHFGLGRLETALIYVIYGMGKVKWRF